MHNQALQLIEDMCYLMSGSLLVKLGMPMPHHGRNDAFNQELEHDRHELDQSVQTNPQQKEVSEWYINEGNWWWKWWLIFPWCPWLNWEYIPHVISFSHFSCQIGYAVAVASSGIVASLLEGCRTAHLAFKLPLNLQTAMVKILK
jgi:PIF1 helicase.